MEILTVLVTGALCCVCFLIGAKVGQTVAQGKDIEVPTVNPMQAIRERQNKQAAEMEQSKMEKVLRNIERYDGTEHGQEDV